MRLAQKDNGGWSFFRIFNSSKIMPTLIEKIGEYSIKEHPPLIRHEGAPNIAVHNEAGARVQTWRFGGAWRPRAEALKAARHYASQCARSDAGEFDS